MTLAVAGDLAALARKALDALDPTSGGDGSDKSKDDSAPASAVSTPGVSIADDLTALSDGMEAIRSGLRRYGAALGAGAGVVLAGIGYSTVNNLFPLPEPAPLATWIGLAALVAAGLTITGVLGLFRMIFAAQRQIVLKSSDFTNARFRHRPANKAAARRKVCDDNDFSDDEAFRVYKILREHAEEQSAADILALELRALRLDRASRAAAIRGDTTATKTNRDESDRLYQVLALASKRACASVLQRRSIEVYRGGCAVFMAALAVAGIAGLFGLADYAKGQRDLIDLRDSCAKAVLVDGAVNACKPVGGNPAPSAPSTPDTSIAPKAAACASALPTGSSIPDATRDKVIAACAGIPAGTD